MPPLNTSATARRIPALTAVLATLFASLSIGREFMITIKAHVYIHIVPQRVLNKYIPASASGTSLTFTLRGHGFSYSQYIVVCKGQQLFSFSAHFLFIDRFRGKRENLPSNRKPFQHSISHKLYDDRQSGISGLPESHNQAGRRQA